MTTSNRSMIMGVFADGAKAQQAMDDLQQAGFSRDQIRYSVRRGGNGIIGSLENLGLPEEEASFYNREFEAGRTVVMVNTTDRQQEAYNLLQRYGAYDSNTGSAQATDYGSTAGTSYGTDTEGAHRVQLREEQLQASKHPVETGQVGIRKEVTTEQQTFDVPVTREEVYIERRPGSGQPADQPIGEGETYRIPVREEQVTVEKQPVVKEEISLGKRQVQETKQVSDTVQREEAHIERTGDTRVQGSNVEDREG